MKRVSRTRDQYGVPRCPDTNKIQHRSEKSTNEYIATRTAKGLVSDGVALRAYKCPWCTWWHETSKPLKRFQSTAQVIAASDSFSTPITSTETFTMTVKRAAT